MVPLPLKFIAAAALLLLSFLSFSQGVGIGSTQFTPLQMLEVRGDATIDNATSSAAFRIANIKVLHNKGNIS